MEQKKPTNAQLQKRLQKAVFHIDRNKETKEVYFNDRGLRIVISDGRALVSQLSFTMVFEEIVAGGYSRVYVALSHLCDMVNNYDCIVTDKNGNVSYSWKKLVAEVEKSKGETRNVDYVILMKFHLWFSLHQNSMFLLSEREDFTFALGAIFAMNTIISGVISKPYDKDMSNKELFDEIIAATKEYRDNLKEEYKVLSKETEEERKMAIARAMESDQEESSVAEQSGEQVEKK